MRRGPTTANGKNWDSRTGRVGLASICTMLNVTPQPLSRGLQLRWDPTPRAFDHQSKLIEALDGTVGVDSFRIHNDSVDVITVSGASVKVDVASLTVHSLAGGKDDDLSVFVHTVEATHEVLATRHRAAALIYQHLEGWSDSLTYEEACKRASRRLAPALSRRFDDFALLADGYVDGHEYQFEAGVIQAEDAPLRLSRTFGRAPSGPDAVPFAALGGISDVFPPVATFVDSRWEVDPGEVASGDTLRHVIAGTQAACAKLVEDIHTVVSQGDSETEHEETSR